MSGTLAEFLGALLGVNPTPFTVLLIAKLLSESSDAILMDMLELLFSPTGDFADDLKDSLVAAEK